MASPNAQLQAARLAQLQRMLPADVETLFARMSAPQPLSALPYHFRRHREEFRTLGIRSEEDYAALFQGHIQRPDLLHFTLLRLRDRRRFWYRVAPDTGIVALYDERGRGYHSFFLPDDIVQFLESGLGWWVEVAHTANGWRVRPWQ